MRITMLNDCFFLCLGGGGVIKRPARGLTMANLINIMISHVQSLQVSMFDYISV